MITHPLDYRLIVFDADGTLRCCREHSTSLWAAPCHNSPDAWRIADRVPETLVLYDWSRIGFGIVSNQAGIALGLVSEETVKNEIEKVIYQLFPRWPYFETMTVSANPEHAYQSTIKPIRLPMHHDWWGSQHIYRYAPFAPDASSYARKPSPWMLLELARIFGDRLDRTLYIGDSAEDEEAAQRAGVTFMPAWQFFGRPEQPFNVVKSYQVAQVERENGR